MRPFNASEAEPVPPFGVWESPVTPERITAGTIGLSELQVDGDAVLWLESRAAEGGRRALVRWTPDGGTRDVLPANADVVTRVHEYGGGGYVADAGRVVYSDRTDDAVWLVEPDGTTRPIAVVPGCRYAAFTFDHERNRVIAVREDHRERPPTDPANAIVALSLAPADAATNDGYVIFGATDFVLAPQLEAGGDRLAIIGWNHPAMPWDATELYVVTLDDVGGPIDVQAIAGGPGESIVAAEWSPDGALLFASDRSNFWNLYAWRDGVTSALAPVQAEIGEPPWVFGRRTFVALGDTHAMAVAIHDAERIPVAVVGGKVVPLPFGPVDTSPLPYGAGAVYLAMPIDAPAAIRLAPSLAADAYTTLRASATDALDPGDVSPPTSRAVPTTDGETTHVTFYPPRNAAVAPDAGARPPLLVTSHGGPTSMHAPRYDLGIAYWTTRGFAVAHVNYRGSSGFGRTYRQRLDGAWGVVDVIDCISVARWLAEAGWCDGTRMAIRGGSASGMTALLAVATSDVFAAATSFYGVMDLTALAAETHKFEARYTDGLIGPLPEAAERYRERSPIEHTGTIDVPVLLLQGLDDHVVPPDQATSMRDALVARGIPVTYEAFAGEGHGFRRAETIQRALELELAFYQGVFGRS